MSCIRLAYKEYKYYFFLTTIETKEHKRFFAKAKIVPYDGVPLHPSSIILLTISISLF